MFVESVLVHSGLVNAMRVIYYTPWIFKFPPELWRLLSSFVLTGGGLSFVFDLYFSESPLVFTIPCTDGRSVYICLRSGT